MRGRNVSQVQPVCSKIRCNYVSSLQDRVFHGYGVAEVISLQPSEWNKDGNSGSGDGQNG